MNVFSIKLSDKVKKKKNDIYLNFIKYCQINLMLVM